VEWCGSSLAPGAQKVVDRWLTVVDRAVYRRPPTATFEGWRIRRTVPAGFTSSRLPGWSDFASLLHRQPGGEPSPPPEPSRAAGTTAAVQIMIGTVFLPRSPVGRALGDQPGVIAARFLEGRIIREGLAPGRTRGKKWLSVSVAWCASWSLHTLACPQGKLRR
jgi:hypothetical protein